MERGQLRGSTRGVERWRKTQRQGVIWGECNLPPSLSHKVFCWVVGVLAGAPLLCVQALQEQRTDIRPKNTLTRPQQLTVETMRASHCSSSLLQPWAFCVCCWQHVWEGSCTCVCVCVWCSFTSCFSTTSHATCSPSNPLKGTSRVSISQRTWTQEMHQKRLLLPSRLRKTIQKPSDF